MRCGQIGFSMAFALGLALTPALAQTTAPPAPAPPVAAALPKIDLKLFDKAEVDRSKGCSVVLWQSDRDPDKDRFAYLMVETLGKNHVREATRIKIGADILTFRRVAVGGAKEFGYKSFPYQLYKMDKEESFLILDLKLADEPGEVVEIDGGTMTVIRPKFPPFVANVKGNAGCNTPAAAPVPQKSTAPQASPTPAPQAARQPALEAPAMFERYPLQPSAIPAKIRADAVKSIGCKEASLRQGAIAYSLSEESALWELNCQPYASSNAKIFLLVYTPDPAKQYTFQRFDIPKGQNHQGDPREMMAPKWDVKSRIISSTYTEGNGSDCGTFQRHQLTDEGKFVLIEYRTKEMCDGKSMKPSEFPLIFRR